MFNILGEYSIHWQGSSLIITRTLPFFGCTTTARFLLLISLIDTNRGSENIVQKKSTNLKKLSVAKANDDQ